MADLGLKRWMRLTVAGFLAVAAVAGGESSPPVKTIEIHAKQYAFVPSEITLKKGETVKLVLRSDDVPHSLAVKGLPIHADMVKEEASTVVVTPAATGDFPGRCAKFCGSGHRDMHFVVHVVN